MVLVNDIKHGFTWESFFFSFSFSLNKGLLLGSTITITISPHFFYFHYPHTHTHTHTPFILPRLFIFPSHSSTLPVFTFYFMTYKQVESIKNPTAKKNKSKATKKAKKKKKLFPRFFELRSYQNFAWEVIWKVTIVISFSQFQAIYYHFSFIKTWFWVLQCKVRLGEGFYFSLLSGTLSPR